MSNPREGTIRGVKVHDGEACLYCQGCGRFLGKPLTSGRIMLKCPVCKDYSTYAVSLPGSLT